MSERLSDSPIVREKLYEQFNARICLLDIYRIYKQIEIGGYKNKKVHLLLLVDTDTDETIDFLNKNFYGDLIFDLVTHVRISEDLEDSLSVKFDKCFIDLFKKALVHPFEKKDIIVPHQKGIMIVTTNFIADVIKYPLSQFHIEVIKAVNCFLPFVRLNKEKESSVFLNAYSPSFFTQYPQFWVAESLDMLKSPSNISV